MFHGRKRNAHMHSGTKHEYIETRSAHEIGDKVVQLFGYIMAQQERSAYPVRSRALPHSVSITCQVSSRITPPKVFQ